MQAATAEEKDSVLLRGLEMPQAVMVVVSGAKSVWLGIFVMKMEEGDCVVLQWREEGKV